MPANRLISMMGRDVNLNQSVAGGALASNALMGAAENTRMAPLRQRAAEATLSSAESKAASTKQMEQLQRAAIDGAYIRQDLSSGDIPTALSRLKQRRDGIIARDGENANTVHTERAIAALQSGDPAQIQALGSELMEIDRTYRQFSGGGTQKPSSHTNIKQTTDGRTLGYNPDTRSYEEIDTGGAQFASSKPETNIYMPGEKEGLTQEQKELASLRVGAFSKLQDAASNAYDQNDTLRQLGQIDITTGWGEELKGSLAGAVNSIFGPGVGDGLLNTNATAMQSFRALSKRMQAAELNKAKGPQTEGDAKRIAETLANMSNEKEANRFLISSLRATNDRKVEQYNFYQRILERDGSLGSAESEWVAYKRKTPMVSDSVRDKGTGLPMFFNDFKQKALERNPQATDDQIVNAWRELQ